MSGLRRERSPPAGGRRAGPVPAGRFAGSAFVLGWALSGLFDGILLHQILQWHHLLSLAPGARTDDLAFQILADGLFHVLMYALALIGLFWLWRDRSRLDSRAVFGGAVLGFGAWNVVDVLLFHWILGIHNIRLDTPDPIAWDVAWLVVLGLLPIAAATSIWRSPPRIPPAAASAALAGLVLLSAIWSVWPAPQGGDTVVVFLPGTDVVAMVEAAAAVDARIIHIQDGSRIMTLRISPNASAWTLYVHGAALVSSAAPGGCLSRLIVAA